MKTADLNILSTYLKKWSYHDNRISLAFSFFTELGYGRNSVDMRINSTHIMISDFLNNVVYKIKDVLLAAEGDYSEVSIRINSESEVKSKLQTFFNKIVKEFNLNKRSRGRSRMISSRSMDFYYNDFEYESLDEDSKFYVHLNRGVNKMNGDLWTTAIEEIEKALTIQSEDPVANKYMALALTKSKKLEESVAFYEKCVKLSPSLKSLNDLAKAYTNVQKYDLAKKTYVKMKKMNPDDLLARIGEAQVAYMQGKPFIKKLDQINKIDTNWLKEYLKGEWAYKIPKYNDEDVPKWNAAVASRYLGYERPFDLTKKAFNNELPCYFNSEKGTIRFVKEELDNWVEMNNRFTLDRQRIEIHPERLKEEELKIGNVKTKKKPAPKRKTTKKQTKVT